jgi:Fe-S cluster assembly protein SufD
MTPAIQNQTDHETDKYWARFAQANFDAKRPAWLYPVRKAAMARFSELGLPTTRDEDWRFTNIAPLARLPFKPALHPPAAKVEVEAIGRFSFSGLKAARLVFVDGYFSQELSNTPPREDGIKVMNLAAALEREPALVEKHLGCHASVENSAFTALNTAFFQDGAFIRVPHDMAIAEPVHLLFISTAAEEGRGSQPRNLIVAEGGSRLTVIESYVSLGTAAAFTNAVDELVIGEGAVVEHCKFQDENSASFHVAALHAHLGRNCDFIAHSIATGARLSRNNIRTSLADEGVECVLNGLYLTRDEQLADHHMIVEHAKPHCNSHEYYNGILDGRSRGVFHGRILVRPDAQKTDAKQTNKNLLLSEEATVDTKPQLEIYADDVKCTHGATVGQLNDESIFYLRARGIGEETAKRMLIHAFAGEIIERVRHAPAREELDRIVWDRLEQHHLKAANG